MKLIFSDNAWADYRHWMDADPKVFARLNDLIESCRRSPFTGIGKPEPLKRNLKGWWSRRLTQEDRIVYRVEGKGSAQQLELAQCRSNY